MSPDQEQQQHESAGLEMGLGFFFSPPPPPPPPFFKREEDGGDQDHESSCSSTGQITKLCARGHWRPAEDAKLRELVSHHGPHNWNLIAEKLQGRSGKSCRLRWFNQLDPRITRRAFSEEEEERLLAAHKAYGNKWAMIASRLFPGRTDNAVKNHWHVLMARRQREQQQQQHSSSTSFRRRPKLLGLLSHGAPSQLHHHHQEDLSNACSGESTITAVAAAKEDRSVSINPTSANNMAIPAGFPNRSPSCLIATTFQQPRLFGFIMGSGEKKLQVQVVAGSEWHEKFGDSGSRTAFNGGGGASLMLQAMGGGQQPAAPSYSTTASEASATESVANQHWTNANNEGSGEKKISFPFFDFLGVGAS